MKILVACEESQVVCKAFRANGHEAYSCDIQECSGGKPEWHLQQDVAALLQQRWDMIVAFPPCTHLCVSGAKHFEKKRKDGRQEEAIEFFMQIINADCKRIAVENPIGIISGKKYIARHFPALQKKYNFPLRFTQKIQPYQFGDPVKKTTCLWLKGLPKLIPTDNVENKVRYYTTKNGTGKRFSEWYVRKLVIDGKKFGYETPEFKKHRSKTFPGIAKAMADQWSNPQYIEQLSLFDMY